MIKFIENDEGPYLLTETEYLEIRREFERIWDYHDILRKLYPLTRVEGFRPELLTDEMWDSIRNDLLHFYAKYGVVPSG